MRLRGGGQKEDLLRLVTCNIPLFIRLHGLQPALHILLHGLQPALPILWCSINLRCVFTLGQPSNFGTTTGNFSALGYRSNAYT